MERGLSCSMHVDSFPASGLKPVSSALAGGFFTQVTREALPFTSNCGASFKEVFIVYQKNLMIVEWPIWLGLVCNNKPRRKMLLLIVTIAFSLLMSVLRHMTLNDWAVMKLGFESRQSGLKVFAFIFTLNNWGMFMFIQGNWQG